MTWHSAAGLDALPAARLHPLVRDTSRPAPGPDLLAFTELAARLLKAAAEAAGETGDPRGSADVVGLAAAGPARCRSAEQPQRSAGQLRRDDRGGSRRCIHGGPVPGKPGILRCGCS